MRNHPDRILQQFMCSLSNLMSLMPAIRRNQEKGRNRTTIFVLI